MPDKKDPIETSDAPIVTHFNKGLQPVLPEPTPKVERRGGRRAKTSGGARFHKAFCKCNACKRKTQALTVATRGGRESATVEETLDIAQKIHDVLYADRVEKAKDSGVLVAPAKTKRDQVARYVELRSEGMKDPEIAQKLGISPESLQRYIRQAVKEQWLVFDSAADRLEYEIVPKAIENVNYFMDARDKQMTIEVMKGTGHFRSHQAVKVEGQVQQNVFAIKFEALPPSLQSTGVIEGQIVSTPKRLTDAVQIGEAETLPVGQETKVGSKVER